MSTQLVTRTQFEYSILSEYTDYAVKIAKRLKIAEPREHELRLFKLATICTEAIRSYFSNYNSDTAPTNDDNGLTKSEIENIVKIFNTILNTNYWFDFPED
jgi:hypothetical protein